MERMASSCPEISSTAVWGQQGCPPPWRPPRLCSKAITGGQREDQAGAQTPSAPHTLARDGQRGCMPAEGKPLSAHTLSTRRNKRGEDLKDSCRYHTSPARESRNRQSDRRGTPAPLRQDSRARSWGTSLLQGRRQGTLPTAKGCREGSG